MSTVIEEFKGFPVLKIESEEDVNGYIVKLTFGLTKAKLILENIEAIKDFVKNYDNI